jgi:lipid A 3-O-deacylase
MRLRCCPARPEGDQMDGRLAALFFLIAGTDASLNYCDAGCFRKLPAQPRLSIGLSDIQFQRRRIGKELWVAYDLGHRRGPVQPTLGASISEMGDAWIGFGTKWTGKFGRVVIESQTMPGIHMQGGGPDLGSPIEFRSGIAVGYQFDNGGRLSLSYDHRSNLDIGEINPGLETVSLRYSIAWK